MRSVGSVSGVRAPLSRVELLKHVQEIRISVIS